MEPTEVTIRESQLAESQLAGAMLARKLELMGIPKFIRDGDLDPDHLIIQAKRDIDAGKDLLTLGGYRVGAAAGVLGDKDLTVQHLNYHGLSPEDAGFAVACGVKFGTLEMDPGDAPRKALPGSKSQSLPCYESAQQSLTLFNSSESIDDLRIVAAANRRLRRERSELELKLQSEITRRERAEQSAADADERVKTHFDQHGNPIWTPANEDESAMLDLSESLRAAAVLFVSRFRKLRCSAGVSSVQIQPDVVSLIRGTVGYVEHLIAAESAAIFASIGFGDGSSESLIRNAASDLLNQTINPAASMISLRLPKVDGGAGVPPANEHQNLRVLRGETPLETAPVSRGRRPIVIDLNVKE